MASPTHFTIAKPSAKFLLYAAINIFLFLIFGALLYGVNRVSRDVIKAKEESETLAFMISQINRLRSASGMADKVTTELRKILPSADQLLFVSGELEALAAASRLQFGFQYGAIEEGPPRAMLFTMSLEGQLTDMMQYFDALTKKVSYIMQFTNFDIISTQEGTHQATIAGKIFIR
jgi:hypothetical protein